MRYQVSHVIDGTLLPGDEGARQHSIYNPALGHVVGQVAFANDDLCQRAVASALKAWPSWSVTPAIQRAQILFRFRALLEQNQRELAQLVTQEHGKTHDDALGSIARAIEVVEFHCGLLSQLQGSFSSNVARGVDTHTIRQSLGVCVGIAPFNFPIMVPTWMVIPAIACGNTFILKPSEQNPSAPVKWLELLYAAGLPEGVVNCLHGDKTVVETLITHPHVSAVAAVASTPVANSIYALATAHNKRAHTFGSAKNHCVVLPDADFKAAAQAIVGAAYGSAGERCMAISVVVAVQDETAQALLAKLLPLIANMRVDSGDSQHCDMGPVISSRQLQKIHTLIAEGERAGANLLVDGRGFQHPLYPQGFFIGPTLFDHVHEAMSIYQQEIFGPVLCMLRVKSLDEAIALVNRHQFGNGTAIFTGSGSHARYYSQSVAVGMVGINIPIPVPVASHPFGGWKQSAFGDTNMHGQESIHFYTRRKTIVTKWPEVTEGNNAFAMTSHR